MQTQSHNWGSRSYIPAPYKRFTIASPNRVLILGASKARKARLTKTVAVATTTTRTIPAENIAAIRLLDSWLSTPDVERDEFQERLDRLVEENRL